MQDTAAKKDTAKLQRTIVDALEDVKAQEIAVFDTEHLTAMFERVIIASGTSNRQTKALASSVRDAVREAGFSKPRVEGEDNGEWIIVDCGQCVVHVMQPAIRTYYHLEEIWGDKPVRLKLGAPKPAVAAAPAPEPAKSKKPVAKKAAAKPGAKRKPVRPEPVFAPPRPELAPPSAAKKAALKKPVPVGARPPASKTAVVKSTAAKQLLSLPAKRLLPNAAVHEAGDRRSRPTCARLGANRVGRLCQTLPTRAKSRA
jgi:ribosome-associated protein